MANIENIAESITAKVTLAFEPEHLELLNESHMHAGPATDSHFNLLVVSQQFAQMSRVKRHQAVYKILAEELAAQVHALALHLYSPAEWQDSAKEISKSPDCEGKKL
tara:strand:- start:102615 stop:102935 length:321 start_codon:yes stop_codon:yes gene_type:complete